MQQSSRRVLRDRQRLLEAQPLGIEAIEPRRMCAAGPALALVRDTGTSATDRLTADATLAVSRPLAAGQRVEYRVNGYDFRPAVMVDARRFVPEGIGADGTYRVAARVVDAGGRATPVGPTLTFRLDRSAAPLQAALKQDTGVSASDRITANAGLLVTGQERRATVQYSRDTGSWDPATAVWGGYAPQPGANRWRIRQVDPAGNASTPVIVEFELDAVRDERVVRVEGLLAGSFEAAAGQRITWVLEFAKQMHVATVAGGVPGIEFRFRGHELMARWSGGGGTTRLEYAYVFTAAQAGAGVLEPPTHACLCFGGLITDPAGNKLRKHELPAVTAV